MLSHAQFMARALKYFDREYGKCHKINKVDNEVKLKARLRLLPPLPRIIIMIMNLSLGLKAATANFSLGLKVLAVNLSLGLKVLMVNLSLCLMQWCTTVNLSLGVKHKCENSGSGDNILRV